MEYLVILGLAGWVWLQWRRIEDLSRDVRALETQVRTLAAEREPLLLTTPLPPDDEPLLLDTPLPAAANDDDSQADSASGTARMVPVAWAIGAALAALFVWFFIAFAADDTPFALGLLATAALLGVAPTAHAPLRARLALAPSLALCIAGVFLIWTWPAAAAGAASQIAGPGAVALLLLALSAYAVRRRWAHPATFAVIVGGVVLGLAGYMRARALTAPPTMEVFAWALLLATAVAALAHATHVNRHGRTTIATAGALGAVALVALAAMSRGEFSSFWSIAALLTGAAAMAGWATLQARSANTDANPSWSAGGAAALALLGVHALTPPLLLPPALALAAWGFAFGFARTDWRVFEAASLVAALLAILHSLGGDFSGASAFGIASPWAAIAALMLAAALTACAWRTARYDNADTSLAAEALRACAALLALRAVFLGIDGLNLAPFTTAALHALALIAAGHAVAPRQEAPAGLIARWQGPVLIGAGLALTLYVCGLALNPWWGDTPARIDGPPLLDPQLIAFLLPALAALITSGRWAERAPHFARWCLFAAVALFVLWLTLEVRRAFHPAMPYGAVGIWEGLIYALVGAFVIGGLRARQDRERFATLVRGSYERIFGAPEPAPPPQPILPAAPGARRWRGRR